MADKFPESFTIEIEHDKLCRYWRRQWAILVGALFLGFGGVIGSAIYLGPEKRQDFQSAMEVAIATTKGIGIGLAGGGVAMALIYFLFLHRVARKEADALHISVEGPYLRIREGASSIKDRKLHFRAIIDYAYFQNSHMRKLDMGGLELNTIGRGQDATVRLYGVKDALAVRDMLSEIDRLREGH